MRPAGPSISIPTKLLATAVACAAALVVCGTAATVVVAAAVTNKLNPKRAEIVAAYRGNSVPGHAFRDIGSTALALDSLVAPLGPVRTLSSTVVASLAALNLDSSNIQLGQSGSRLALPGPVPDVLHQRPKLSLTADSLRLIDPSAIRAATRDPWLPLFREWARAPRQPALWSHSAGLPAPTVIVETPLRTVGPWRVLFAENEFSALLALREGDRVAAMERARENVAAARNFIEQPIVIDAVIGRIFLRRSLKVLAFVASSSGDSTTARQASRLDTAATNFLGTFNRLSLLEDESNANSQSSETFAANRSMHPSLRIESLSTITWGGCHNLPELVFGFNEKRRAAMKRAVANVRDIDRGTELGARQEKLLEYVMDLRNGREADALKSIFGRGTLLSAFSWIVPPGVRARAAVCLEQGL
ncbi:MAG: hypothetical protein ABJB74_14560 [Gemmatimonas sp.]